MRKIFKWIGIVLGTLIGLVLLAGVALFLMGNARLNKVYSFEPTNLTLPTDAASIEYGKHRAETLCMGCHATDLSGIDNWFNAPPLGVIDSANLTTGEGGLPADFATEDFVLAIRHGVGQDGKPIFMPAVTATSNLSDEDLASIIAYLKTIPPVDHTHQERHFTPLANILLAAGMLGSLPVESVSHDVHVTAPERGITAEYGGYLVNINDCRVCHGPDLNGGPFPDPTITKISPNITPGGELGFWTEEEFITAFQTGVTPNGRQLDPDFMPWKEFANFSAEEAKAIWLYLQSLPKLEQYTE